MVGCLKGVICPSMYVVFDKGRFDVGGLEGWVGGPLPKNKRKPIVSRRQV